MIAVPLGRGVPRHRISTVSRGRASRNGAGADLVVVGLGNPGSEYAQTRHNVGQWVIHEVLRRHGGRLRRLRRDHVQVAELRLDEGRLVAAIPSTWMNESGQAVRPLVRRYGITELGCLAVLHDELDLPVGRLKVKFGGGIAGHKGLESVRSHLGSENFTRLRLGIGKPPTTARGGSYVLKRPAVADRSAIEAMVQRAADAIECLLADGLAVTMNRFNTA